jgi:hypothetical protein
MLQQNLELEKTEITAIIKKSFQDMVIWVKTRF